MSHIVERLNTALEGRYRVDREIGQGGMATVYLADDLRHERQVALKVLKPELAAVVGGDRFLAEIKTTAGLQHPHILPLHDSGEADSFLFFVMPYIEGETLRDRIDREKQLPVDEALGITTAVANALQAAHDKGIVHRDIKPGNILLSSGQPLVADFGIALAVGAAGGSRLTETGLSVGTPFYMSPEQATGDQAIGAASDTYSLACVLYEMLTGEPPYPGTTAQAVLGKIIQGIPVSATAVRKTIPLNVDAAIRKALEKLPADRFRDAGGFAKALADPTFRHGETPGGVERAAAGAWNRLSMGLAASTVLLAGAFGWSMTRAPEPPPTQRQIVEPMWDGQARAIGAYTALAPDGSGMVYARLETGDAWQLWYKSEGSIDPIALGGTEGARNVVYAPNSERIAFVSGSDVKTRPIGDGATVTVAEDAFSAMVGLAWMDDGTLLYEGEGQSVIRVPQDGGAAETLARWEDMAQLSYIGALPGSHGALVTVCAGACQQGSELHVLDLETNETALLLEDVIRAWYLPTGHLMYVRGDGAVFAAPFDLGALSLTGTGVSLFEGVQIEISTPDLAVAADGTVLYRTGTVSNTLREVVWVDRDGTVTPVDPTGLPQAAYFDLALSPENDRLAISIVEDGAPRLWVKELPTGPMVRLTTGEQIGHRPEWSADGQRIAFVDQTPNAWWTRADGSMTREVLFTADQPVFELHYAPGDSEIVTRLATGANGRIALYEPDADSVSPLLGSDFPEWMPRISPDGRWIAYVSTQSGTNQVYVRPYPSMDAQTQISTNGGDNPVWAHNGRELFYGEGDGFMTVAMYETEPTFRVVERTRVVNAVDQRLWRPNNNWRSYDLAADDERAITLRTAGGSDDPGLSESRIILVRNFFTDLMERLGGN